MQIHSEYLCLAAPVLLPDHMNSLVLVLAAHPVRHHNESAPARLKPKCIAKASGNSKSKPRRCIATGIISGKPEDVVGPRVARHSLFGEQFEHSVRLEAICGIDLFFFQQTLPGLRSPLLRVTLFLQAHRETTAPPPVHSSRQDQESSSPQPPCSQPPPPPRRSLV